MSLIRQVWLLLWLTLATALAGAIGVSVHSARQYLATQLTQKNNDTAQALALTMSQWHGDLTGLELALSSQFDTGNYQHMALVAANGKSLVVRSAAPRAGVAPAWFVDWLSIAPGTGIAQVSDGWKPLGRLEVLSQVDYAHDELWHSTLVTAGLLAGVAAIAGLIALLGVRRIRQPLDAVVRQATALTERRFVTVSEPQTPELREVTRAMNTMVARLKSMFDEQAGQVEQLRRQANCDALTGVSNRAHFMSRLKVLLDSEDGSASGALVLVRLTELQGMNRKLGRAATDQLLQQAAAAISESADRAAAAEIGRLNGSDFAIILSDVGSLREPAIDVAARLRNLLRGQDTESAAVVGAVRWWHGAPLSSLLAAADQALARAEARGPYAVELDDSGDGVVLGEAAWRQRIETALAEHRLRLVEFPLVDGAGDVVHLECPLRLQLDAAGEWTPAAQWLPMARRAQLTGRIDLAAVQLALQAITVDGVARAVNVSPGSLLDGNFTAGLRVALSARPDAAPGLWLEVAEAGAMRHLPLLRELVAQAHAFGTRVGLEHAGDGLADSASLLEAGLDFVKLDASFTLGLSGDSARAQHVGGSVRMLHGIGLSVYAEGVGDTADAQALWLCGVDGLTGPVVARLDGPSA
jgi:diguanylate cyclase (GGDEF)-like protein